MTIRPDAPFRIDVAAKPAGAAESFSLRPSSGGIAAGAPDAPGLIYALLELAQRAGEDRFGLTAPIA